MQDTRTARCNPAGQALLVQAAGPVYDPVLDVHGRLFCMAISPSGHVLVAGGDGPDLFFVNLATGQCEAVIGHPESTVEALVFLDDRTLVSCAGDGGLATWDVPGRDPFQKVQAHSRGIFAVLHDRARSLLVTGGLDGEVKRWHLPGVSPAGASRATGRGVLSLAFAGVMDAGTVARLACGTVSGRVDIFDPRGTLAVSWKAHAGPVFAVKQPQGDPRWLLSAGADGHVKAWDLRGPRLAWDIDAGQGKVLDVHVAASGGSWFLLTAGGDGSIKRWVASAGMDGCHAAGKEHPHARTVERIIAVPGGGRLLSVSSDGTIRDAWRGGSSAGAWLGHGQVDFEESA